MSQPTGIAAKLIAENEASETAFVNGLIAGGATPLQIFQAGMRRGNNYAGYEDGLADAIQLTAPAQ